MVQTGCFLFFESFHEVVELSRDGIKKITDWNPFWDSCIKAYIETLYTYCVYTGNQVKYW